MTAEIERPIASDTAPTPWLGTLAPRRPVTVRADVSGSEFVHHGHSLAFVCELTDPTGALDLVFLGRRHLGGFERGRRVEATGTPYWRAGRLVMLNPVYTLLPPA